MLPKRKALNETNIVHLTQLNDNRNDHKEPHIWASISFENMSSHSLFDENVSFNNNEIPDSIM